MQVLLLVAFFANGFELRPKQIIFEMPRDSLSLEERFSPIKLTNIRQPMVKESLKEKESYNGELTDKTSRPIFDGLIKHPHGLQVKHRYRRNTITHANPIKTPAKHIVHTIRDVVTSPRLVAPILQPDHSDSIADSPSYRIRNKKVTLTGRFDEIPNVSGDFFTRHSHADTSNQATSYGKRSSDDFTVPVPKHRRFSLVNALNASDAPENLLNNLKPPGDMNSSPEKPGLIVNLARTLNSSLPSKIINDDSEAEYTEGKIENPETSHQRRLVYTASEMDISRQKLYNEITKLEMSIKTKNDEIILLNNDMNEAENKILRLSETLDENFREKDHLQESLRLTGLQVTNLNDELDSVNKKLIASINLLRTSEAEVDAIRQKHLDECHHLKVSISDLEEHSKKLEENLAQCSLTSNELKSENEQLKLLMKALSDEKMKLRRDFESITNSRDVLLAKLDELKNDKEILTLRLETQQTTLVEKNEQLVALNQKFKELCEETTNLHNEMAKFETEQKLKDRELTEKNKQIEELSSLCSQFEDDVSSLRSELHSTRVLIEDDSSTKINLQSENESLLKSVEDLRKQNLEKDKIISGDTKKLTELVEEVDRQKQVISDYKMNVNKSEVGSESELLKQIASLKHQVATAQQKTDERIQDVAEQLYHQYSKKHELKVNQLKEKYDTKMEENLLELELKRREIETLESQLKTEMKEKNYLLSALEKSDISLKRTPSGKKL